MAETGDLQITGFRNYRWEVNQSQFKEHALKRNAPARHCSQKANITIFERWPVAFKAVISVIAPRGVQQWKIHLAFSKTVTLLQVPKATYLRINKTCFILTRAPWAPKTLKQGDKLEIEFIAYVRGQLPHITALFAWKGTCIPTSQPPTENPSTPQITTENLTTLKPSTHVPSTDQPSTPVLSTDQPSTHVPSTDQPSTHVPSTVQPSTLVPSTVQPLTHVPSTDQPSTDQPSTHVPSTDQPSTHVPSTDQPSTLTTHVRSTDQPSTHVPSTVQPSTLVPSTVQPLTHVPSTDQPSTHVPSTDQPSTHVPSTDQPSTLTTHVPSTDQPSTLTTHVPSTDQPSTHVPSTDQPSTHVPSSDQPSTYIPTTTENVFPEDCSKTVSSITEPAGREKVNVLVVKDWPQGFKGTMKITILEDIVDGWEIHLFFSNQIKSLTVWRVLMPKVRTGTRFILKNMPWNKVLKKDMILEVSFLAFKIDTMTVPNMCAVFVWNRNSTLPSSVPTAHSSTVTTNQITTEASTYIPSTDQTSTYVPSSVPTTHSSTVHLTTETPTSLLPSTFPTKQPTPEITTKETLTTPSTTYKPSSKYPYNYDEVLHKSILFYEAQRSGVLPSSNRISWRGNSAVKDRGENGEDLVGGWYDAGDHVKFGFPMTFSTTLLTWGFLEYGHAYVDSGELQYMLDCIKWPLDYFIKAHVKPDVLYGQVTFIYPDFKYFLLELGKY